MTDYEWAISINRLMLKLVGLWPPDNTDFHRFVGAKLRRLCSFVMFIVIFTIPCLISLIRIWGDIMLMIDNMQFSVPVVMVTLKVGIIWYNQGGIYCLNIIVYY